MSSGSTSLPIFSVNEKATATFDAAFVETRDLSYFMISAIAPIVVILGLILLTSVGGRTLGYIVIAGGIVVLVALLKLIHDLVYDIAGFPDYKMPVWTVLYSILYIIEGFTFLFFGLHLVAPSVHFKGIATGSSTAFLDCLYLSLARTFGVPPEASFQATSQLARFLPVLQSGLMMFLNIVIITKFVTAF
jgi:hypothetical protein